MLTDYDDVRIANLIIRCHYPDMAKRSDKSGDSDKQMELFSDSSYSSPAPPIRKKRNVSRPPAEKKSAQPPTGTGEEISIGAPEINYPSKPDSEECDSSGQPMKVEIGDLVTYVGLYGNRPIFTRKLTYEGSDNEKGWVCFISELGDALLGKSVGDVAEYQFDKTQDPIKVQVLKIEKGR